MPHFANRVPDLRSIGPIIEVVVFPPAPVFQKLKSEGKVPPSKKVTALIDTGATASCIDVSLVAELGLIARDNVAVLTPAGPTRQDIFDLGFAMPSMALHIIPLTAAGALLGQQPYRALLGRDILSMCTLVYNGWDNSYHLHI